MDVGAAGALSQYQYQTTLKGLTQAQGTGAIPASLRAAQSEAVLQTLTTSLAGTASGANSLLPAADALSSLAGSGALAPLMSGIYQASTASGDASATGSAFSTARASLLAANTSSLAGLFPESNGSPFSSALGQGTSLAMVAYNAHQEGLSGTVTAMATRAAAGVDLSSPAGIQNAIQSVQSNLVNSTLNMLG